MEKKKKVTVTLSDLNAPKELVGSYEPRWYATTRTFRRLIEEDILQKVYDWLVILNYRFGLGMSLTWDKNAVEGMVINEKGNVETVAYFFYKVSNSHIYKNQDFKKLLKLISAKLINN